MVNAEHGDRLAMRVGKLGKDTVHGLQFSSDQELVAIHSSPLHNSESPLLTAPSLALRKFLPLLLPAFVRETALH